MSANVISNVAGTPDNSIIVLDQSNDGTTMSTLSASTATLRTFTVPGGLMGANDSIRITTLWSFLNNANTKLVYVDFDGQLIINENVASNGISAQLIQTIRADNSTSAQKSWNNAKCDAPYVKTTSAFTTSTKDTTVDFDIRVRAVSNGTDTVTCESVIIELLRAP